MNIKTALKTSVATAALFAVAAPVSTPAYSADDTFKSGNKNSLTMSGYVTKTVQFVDAGPEEQLFITDGGTSESRIRWIASGKLSENVSAGGMIELEIPLSIANAGISTAGASGNGETAAGVAAWGIRHQYVWVSHKKFGKISLGQTDAAANGATEASLSNTTWIDLSGGKPFGIGQNFIETGDATPSRSANTVNSVFTNFDMTSRTDVIRYDTPKFAGLGLRASLNNAGGGEIGAVYSGKFGGFSVLAKFGYAGLAGTSTTVEDRLGVSAAVLHSSGINASIGYGRDNLKVATNDDPWNGYGSVGYRAKIFGVGGTNFNAHWNRTHHARQAGAQAEAWGITATQHFDAIGARMGIVYANYEYNDSTGATFDDIDVVALTTIFNF